MQTNTGTTHPTAAAPAAMITLPRLWTQKDLAAYLGKSLAWCERARWAGEGPRYVKLGRHVRYRVADVLSWLDDCQVGGGNA